MHPTIVSLTCYCHQDRKLVNDNCKHFDDDNLNFYDDFANDDLYSENRHIMARDIIQLYWIQTGSLGMCVRLCIACATICYLIRVSYLDDST